MKKIIYTQRVEIVESYGERRDCADLEIAKLIWECGFLPVPVNNIPKNVQVFLEQIKPDGMILTGGNDLSKYGGNAPERDETEKRMIEYGIKNEVPIYGFCRGMQMIADYFGAGLTKVEKHVGVRHRLKGNAPWNGRTVNSFHNMAVKTVTEDLVIEARSEDGVIEALRARDNMIYGTMWHPEREKPYEKADIQFIIQIFLKEGL
ncbi:MAG: gamma-glutamyl-gamma-aminobutyrate hydrolase family protein [Lachnospiraceae bacterium]|nr:gamma-glutamyl-gamma-aminobutyrate hydrolase family protein [Lachnospiraceae bacterium]